MAAGGTDGPAHVRKHGEGGEYGDDGHEKQGKELRATQRLVGVSAQQRSGVVRGQPCSNLSRSSVVSAQQTRDGWRMDRAAGKWRRILRKDYLHIMARATGSINPSDICLGADVETYI